MTLLFTAYAATDPQSDDAGNETGEVDYTYEVEKSEIVAEVRGFPSTTYFVKSVNGLFSGGVAVDGGTVGINHVANTGARYALSEDEARAMATLRLWAEDDELTKKQVEVRKKLQAVEDGFDGWLERVTLILSGPAGKSRRVSLKEAFNEFGPEAAVQLAHRRTIRYDGDWVSCSMVGWDLPD